MTSWRSYAYCLSNNHYHVEHLPYRTRNSWALAYERFTSSVWTKMDKWKKTYNWTTYHKSNKTLENNHVHPWTTMDIHGRQLTLTDKNGQTPIKRTNTKHRKRTRTTKNMNILKKQTFSSDCSKTSNTLVATCVSDCIRATHLSMINMFSIYLHLTTNKWGEYVRKQIYKIVNTTQLT